MISRRLDEKKGAWCAVPDLPVRGLQGILNKKLKEENVQVSLGGGSAVEVDHTGKSFVAGKGVHDFVQGGLLLERNDDEKRAVIALLHVLWEKTPLQVSCLRLDVPGLAHPRSF